jgi:hypothetical protein
MYGPTGVEYTGSLEIPDKIRYDIATGRLVYGLSKKIVMSL